jgi:hypothetical protein
MEPNRIPYDRQHKLRWLNCVPLPIDNNFSWSGPHQIMLTKQINSQLVHGDSVVPLARVLHREDLQSFDCHLDPNLLLFRRQKWETHRRCRTVRRSDCVRCQCGCTADLGRQSLRESSRTDENGHRNSARGVSIASSTGLPSTSGVSGGLASFRPEN